MVWRPRDGRTFHGDATATAVSRRQHDHGDSDQHLARAKQREGKLNHDTPVTVMSNPRSFALKDMGIKLSWKLPAIVTRFSRKCQAITACGGSPVIATDQTHHHHQCTCHADLYLPTDSDCYPPCVTRSSSGSSSASRCRLPQLLETSSMC